MLQSVDEQGTITWECHWRTHDGAPACGQENTYHLSHEGVQWLNEREIAIPACVKCGAKMTIRIPTEEEMTPPIITRDETGQIMQVEPAPGYEHFFKHWQKDADIVHDALPHPTLQHLSLDEIRAMQEHIKAKAPNAPVDWMVSTTPREVIHAVSPRAFVAHHQELARQMQAAGKVWSEPEVVQREPMVPLSRVRSLVEEMLRERGIIIAEE